MRKALIAFGAAVLILLLGVFIGNSGQVTGVEFSPDTFEHRSFRYYAWCGIQVTPAERHVWRSAVDSYLHENGYAASEDSQPQRWQLSKAFCPGLRGWSGPAKHLCQGIGCYGSKDEMWVQWSNENPDLADALWPRVVDWAREEKYAEIMCLFRFTDLSEARTKGDILTKIESAKQIALN